MRPMRECFGIPTVTFVSDFIHIILFSGFLKAFKKGNKPDSFCFQCVTSKDTFSSFYRPIESGNRYLRYAFKFLPILIPLGAWRHFNSVRSQTAPILLHTWEYLLFIDRRPILHQQQTTISSKYRQEIHKI